MLNKLENLYSECSNAHIYIFLCFRVTTVNAKGRIYFTKSTASQRLEYCQKISTVFKDGVLETIQMKDFKVTSVGKQHNTHMLWEYQ